MAVAFGDAEVCTVTNTLGARTPFGSNVAATPIDVSTGDFPVSILFGFVGSAGVTTLESSATGPNPPAGFDVDGSYYHLESTAEFAAAEVCFPYTGTPPSIVHWVAGTPEILLTTRHTSTLVCAEVDSFSPFALARPTGGDDTDAPDVTCGSADGDWHGDNVAIRCTATDAGSGVADADAEFSLATSVPAGTEDANAQTGSRQVCDLAGNCARGRTDRRQQDRPQGAEARAAGRQDRRRDLGRGRRGQLHRDGDRRRRPASGRALHAGLRSDVHDRQHRRRVHRDRPCRQHRPRLVRRHRARRQGADRPPDLRGGGSVEAAARGQDAAARADASRARALRSGQAAQRKAMCDALATFATAVRLLSGHGITAAQATQWIADANRIRAVIGCGTR